MSDWTLTYYETERGRCPVREYLDDLDARDAAAVTYSLDLLAEFGTALGAPHTKHLRGKVWELRSKGRVQHRVLYFAAVGRTLVALHAFTKKSQQTPPGEVTIALDRLADYEARHEA